MIHKFQQMYSFRLPWNYIALRSIVEPIDKMSCLLCWKDASFNKEKRKEKRDERGDDFYTHPHTRALLDF